MDLGLQGRTALVCAASKGIGRGIAAALVAEGAEVTITSRSRENVEAAASAIGATGLVWETGDLDAIPAVLEQTGPLDVLVCNTGGPPPGAPLEFTREQWEAAHRDLVLAPVALLQAVLPGMRERGWGRVVNVASTSVREPIPGLLLSSAQRSAVLATFKDLAREVARDGVTLNTVLPGRIATDRLAGLDAPETGIPAGRVGTVQDMGALAAFLCSDLAGYVTGQAIAVDGGLLQSV